MLSDSHNDFILIETNADGEFLVTISDAERNEIFSEVMVSKNHKIYLEGFSLQKHKVVFSPVD